MVVGGEPAASFRIELKYGEIDVHWLFSLSAWHVLFQGSLHIFGLRHCTDRLSDPSAHWPTCVEVFVSLHEEGVVA